MNRRKDTTLLLEEDRLQPSPQQLEEGQENERAPAWKFKNMVHAGWIRTVMAYLLVTP